MNTNDSPRTASLISGTVNSTVANAVPLEQMLALLPDLVFIHDLQEARHIYCNSRLEAVLGLSTEKFLNAEIGRAHV